MKGQPTKNKLLFTVDAVEGLPLSPIRVLYWDTQVTGFGVAVGKKSKSYIVVGKIRKGSDIRMTLGRVEFHTLGEARDWAKDIREKIRHGVDPRKNPTHSITMSTVTWMDGLEMVWKDMYEKGRAKTTIQTFLRNGECYKALTPWLDRPVIDLKTKDLQKIYDDIISATTPRVTSANRTGEPKARRCLVDIGRVWNMVDKHFGSKWPEVNPLRGIKLPILKANRTRIPTNGFRIWLQQVCDFDKRRRDLHIFTLITGLRAGSVCSMQWDDIDMDLGQIYIRITKCDKPYTLPMTSSMRTILTRVRQHNIQDFPNGDDGWVFPTWSREGRQVVKIKWPKVKGEKIPSLHTLRRTFNSVAAEDGVSQQNREFLLNHSPDSMHNKHYTILDRHRSISDSLRTIERGLLNRLGLASVEEVDLARV